MTYFSRVPAKDCGFGCGAKIYRNKELGIYQEEWTDIIHDKRRCWAIKEKQKRDAIGNNKAPRLEVVEELRDVLLKLTYGIPMHEQVYHLIKSRRTKDDAITIKELAMALNPEKIHISKDGTKEPSSESLDSAREALYRARKWKLNDNIAPFAVRFLNGQFRYWNMQTKDEFKPVKKRTLKRVEGELETVKRFENMIDLGSKIRRSKEERLDAMLNLRRKKKKQDEDGVA